MDPRRPASVPSVAHAFVSAEISSLDEHVIEGADGHHLARVLRVRVNDVVTVADGRGAWRVGRVRAVGRSSVDWVADGVPLLEPLPVPELGVAFALGKAGKPERVVRQLTELGIDWMRPVTTARTIVRWSPEKVATMHERFVRIAREAAMQARRGRLPRVDPLMPLESLAGLVGLLVGAPDGDGFGALTEGGVQADGAASGWSIVVGPEGGFAPGEIDALGPHRVVAVSPTVLRTETAPVAIAAVLAARRLGGEWDTPG